MQYTTVLHSVRKRFGLSCNDFCIADSIFKLSANPSAPIKGWCTQSRSHMADEMDLSKRTVIEIVKKLEGKGLVVRNDADHLQTTQLWFDAVILAKEEISPEKKQKEGGAETAQGVQKLHTTDSEKTAHPMQKVHPPHAETAQDGGAETAHNNKSIDNKRYNQQQNAREETVDVVDAGFELAKRKINQVREAVLKAEKFKADLCIPARAKNDQWPLYVNTFFDSQIALAETGQPIDYDNLRLHFKNWFHKQIEIGERSILHPNYKPLVINERNVGPTGQFIGSTPQNSVKYPIRELN